MRAKLFIAQIFLMILIGCSEKSSEKETPSNQRDTEKEKADLKNVDAEQIQQIISSYKGDKSVLVNIWATWCTPCVEEFPEIVKIQQKYPEKLQVIFISADFPEDRNRAVKFLKEHDVNWATYFKNDKDEPFINAISKDWTGALPFTKIINKSGNEVTHWENKANFDTFNNYVQQAINP